METKALIPTFGRRGLLAPLANLREEMDKLFNDWLKDFDFEPLRMFEGEATFMPRLDIREYEKELEVVVELPGLEKKDVHVELAKDALILSGEKKLEKEEKGEGYLRHERRFGTFNRVIKLPWEVEVGKVAVVASFVNGVLTIKVPKPTEAVKATRKIAITT